MNNPVKNFNRASILPCAILCLSILSLCMQPVNVMLPGVYVSIAGLVVVILYFFNVNFWRPLAFLWILAQLVVIKHGSYTAGIFASADVWDLTQGIRALIYLPVDLGSAGLVPGINLVALLMLGLMWFLRTEDLVGTYLHFAAYRHDNSLGIVFPLKGRVERFVCLSEERDWLLVNLLAPFTYNGKTIWYVLIKRNDKQPLIRHQANQLVFFNPVQDVNMIREKNNKLDFEEGVWALCR